MAAVFPVSPGDGALVFDDDHRVTLAQGCEHVLAELELCFHEMRCRGLVRGPLPGAALAGVLNDAQLDDLHATRLHGLGVDGEVPGDGPGAHLSSP